MTDNPSDPEINPERIDDTTPEGAEDVDGTTSGNPVAGVEIEEAELEDAVVPDDNAEEVDGPTQKHA